MKNIQKVFLAGVVLILAGCGKGDTKHAAGPQQQTSSPVASTPKGDAKRAEFDDYIEGEYKKRYYAHYRIYKEMLAFSDEVYQSSGIRLEPTPPDILAMYKICDHPLEMDVSYYSDTLGLPRQLGIIARCMEMNKDDEPTGKVLWDDFEPVVEQRKPDEKK